MGEWVALGALWGVFALSAHLGVVASCQQNNPSFFHLSCASAEICIVLAFSSHDITSMHAKTPW